MYTQKKLIKLCIAYKNYHTKYKKYRNILTSVIRNADKLFYKKYLSNCCNNSKKTQSILSIYIYICMCIYL